MNKCLEEIEEIYNENIIKPDAIALDDIELIRKERRGALIRGVTQIKKFALGSDYSRSSGDSDTGSMKE